MEIWTEMGHFVLMFFPAEIKLVKLIASNFAETSFCTEKILLWEIAQQVTKSYVFCFIIHTEIL